MHFRCISSVWECLFCICSVSFTHLTGWHQLGWSCVPKTSHSLREPQFWALPFLAVGSIHHDKQRKNIRNNGQHWQLAVGWRWTDAATISSQVSEIWANLLKHKRLLVPHWVDGVGRGGPLGAIFLLGVAREPDDFHLHARFHALVGQELAWVNLVRREVKQDMKVAAWVCCGPIVLARVRDTGGINRGQAFSLSTRKPCITLSMRPLLLQNWCWGRWGL